MSAPRVGFRTLTTAHLSAAHPFFAAGPVDTGGVLVGRDPVTGHPVAVDPWRLYADGTITSPGTLIAGQVGLGKSALVKTWVARQTVMGRRATIIDPKGEYGPLADWFGTSPIVLRPGGVTRLNPLDPAIAPDTRASIVAALIEHGLGHPMLPVERAALEAAVRRAATRPAPVLGDVIRALRAPDPADADALGTTPRGLAVEARSCRLELQRLCTGELAGMLDGATTEHLGRDAPVVVFDVHALHGSPALGAVMTCIAAWHDALATRPHRGRILVVDEAWALVGTRAGAQFLGRSWKLARAAGVQNILIVHRLTDLSSADGPGSAAAAIADGLVSESEILVLMRQSPADLALTRERLGLTDTEADLLVRLPRGTALWRIGAHGHLVVHMVSSAERALIDTDAAMRAGDR